MPEKTFDFLKSLKWTARILSILCSGFILTFMIGEGFNPFKSEPVSLIMQLFFPIGCMAGMLIAWLNEGLGGSITAASIMVFYLLHFILFRKIPAGPWFILVSSPGILFVIYRFFRKPGKIRR